MLIGYMRLSKADGSQVLDLQHDALLAAGVGAERLYEDHASGKRDDRLGRDLRHLVNLVGDLTQRGAGLRVLAGSCSAVSRRWLSSNAN